MTDIFKNLTINTVVEDGKVTSITMPVTGQVINIVYGEDGGILDVRGADGNTLDMSTAVGAVGIDYSIYTLDEDTLDDPLGDSAPTILSVADKIVDINGKLVDLEFDEKGRLVKEVNSKFTSYYFLKEMVNYGPKCTNRLAYLYGSMLAMVREVKLEDGTLAYDEVLFGNVLTRTAASEVSA